MLVMMDDNLNKILLDSLRKYAENEHKQELISILLSTDIDCHYTIVVDAVCIFANCVKFAHILFNDPRQALKLLDDSFRYTSETLIKKHDLRKEMSLKRNLHVRLCSLPLLPDIYRKALPSLDDAENFVCLTGTIIHSTPPKILEYKKEWRCTKCKKHFIAEAEIENGYCFEKPLMCPNPDWCTSKNFTLLTTEINPENCKDYQEIRIQEQIFNLNVGAIPKTMWVILEDDLIETCQPGNDVLISGIVIRRFKPFKKGSFIDIDIVLLAHNVEVKNKISYVPISKEMVNHFKEFWLCHLKDSLKGVNFILSCICPQVFGLYIVKLAVALVLAGGVQKTDGNSNIRGDSHLLLVGDPGTAKSQFLKYAAKISSRSVFTSGIGTTNAGLTASAVKDGGKWQLEAGALVLADGGICCIDEFSSIKEQDKTCIHEAMEQQTISVAKAGLVCTLNSACSILAATNPKGKYDKNASLSENTALGTPLLSRFDIILVLLDTYDAEWDKMVSTYILEEKSILSENCEEVTWSLSQMQHYFSLIRCIIPDITEECERILKAYYTKQRSLEMRSAARTTPRLFQSLIRLAESHARLMFREKVMIIDAIIAIILMESSMLGSSIIQEINPLYSSFPKDPKLEYETRAKAILKSLNLEIYLNHIHDHENTSFLYGNLNKEEFGSRGKISDYPQSFNENENINSCCNENGTIINNAKSNTISQANECSNYNVEKGKYKNNTSSIINKHNMENESKIDHCNLSLSSISMKKKNANFIHKNEISTLSQLNKEFNTELFDSSLEVLPQAHHSKSMQDLNKAAKSLIKNNNSNDISKNFLQAGIFNYNRYSNSQNLQRIALNDETCSSKDEHEKNINNYKNNMFTNIHNSSQERINFTKRKTRIVSLNSNSNIDVSKTNMQQFTSEVQPSTSFVHVKDIDNESKKKKLQQFVFKKANVHKVINTNLNDVSDTSNLEKSIKTKETAKFPNYHNDQSGPSKMNILSPFFEVSENEPSSQNYVLSEQVNNNHSDKLKQFVFKKKLNVNVNKKSVHKETIIQASDAHYPKSQILCSQNSSMSSSQHSRAAFQKIFGSSIKSQGPLNLDFD